MEQRSEKHGLFRLYPALYNPGGCDVDIVAIHGLAGDAYNTWTDKNGHLWLRDSLPDHVPQARIMTFGYDSAFMFGTSHLGITDFAADLQARLRFMRTDERERTRPLVFICHSLGGIVFKEFMVRGGNQTHGISKWVRGVVFLGTPHRGSRAASTGRILSRVINMVTLGKGVRSDLLQALRISSTQLDAISAHAELFLRPLSIISFYERKPLGAGLIVEPFSAVLGLPNERAIPLNVDHRDIARLSPRRSQSYLPVWSSVKELVEASRPEAFTQNKELLQKLFSIDYKVAQLRPRQPHPGTCDWIFGNQKYSSWMKSNQSAMLVISGQAGTGKSVLTRFVNETILAGGESEAVDHGYLSASFYCSYYEEAQNKQSVENVLRSLLHQLIQMNPRCAALVRKHLEKRDKYGKSKTDLSSQSLWMALKDVLAMDTMRKTVITIDAVEELDIEHARSIVDHLSQMVNDINTVQPQSRLRILISCRYSPTAIPAVIVLRLSKVEMRESIWRYVSESVEEFAAQHEGFRSSANLSTRVSLIEKIVNRADGMFLWAVVAWDDFTRGLLWNREVVSTKMKRLDSISPGMNGIYAKMLDRIDESIREEALSIFAILAVAARPLNEVELGTILGICSTENVVNRSSDFAPFRNLGDIIEKNMPELVTIHDDNTITFMHMSVKEYLEEKWGKESPQTLAKARRNIVRACLKYLKIEDMLDEADDGRSRSELDAKYPFMLYASSFFLWHLKNLPHDDDMWDLFATLGRPRSIFTLKPLWPEAFRPTTPLWTVIFSESCTDESLVRRFVLDGYDVNERWLPSGSRGSILRHCCYSANSERHRKLAFLLLSLGADPSLPDGAASPNIGLTIRAKAWDLYEALVKNPKTDLDGQDARGWCVLHYHVELAPTEVLCDFINSHRSLNVNLQDSNKFTPLHLATLKRKLAAVSKLITIPSIRLDLQDEQGRTPLALAAYWGYQDIALELCKHSEALPGPDRDALSPLYAAMHGQLDLTRHLLRLSGFRNLSFYLDMSGRGILHHAAVNNWADVADECLRRGGSTGLNVNMIDHSGASALHVACALGSVATAAALLRHGASVRLQDRLGRTAAIAAADAGFKEVLTILLERAAVDVRQRDFEGRTLVHWAATLDCVDVIAAVAALPGAELARRDRHGKMAVDIAASCQCRDVGRYLVRAMKNAGVTRVYFDIYNWDGMYNSPEVEAVEDVAVEKRQAINQALRASHAARVERQNIRRMYPEELWALVHCAHKEARRHIEALPQATGIDLPFSKIDGLSELSADAGYAIEKDVGPPSTQPKTAR